MLDVPETLLSSFEMETTLLSYRTFQNKLTVSLASYFHIADSGCRRTGYSVLNVNIDNTVLK